MCFRSLHSLNTNWAGVQDPYTIASGVLNFEPDGVGHYILQQALDHMNTNFDGANWSSNGPELITKIILKECQVPNVSQLLVLYTQKNLPQSKISYLQ